MGQIGGGRGEAGREGRRPRKREPTGPFPPVPAAGGPARAALPAVPPREPLRPRAPQRTALPRGARGQARLYTAPPAIHRPLRPLPSSVPGFRPAMARAAPAALRPRWRTRAGRADFGLAGPAPRRQEAAVAAGGCGVVRPPPPSPRYPGHRAGAVGNGAARGLTLSLQRAGGPCRLRDGNCWDIGFL